MVRNKKRGRGEGSVHRRADGRWMAKIYVTGTDGLKIRKSIYAPTQREVIEKLDKAKQSIRSGIPLVSERRLLNDVLNEWLNSTKGRVREKTFIRHAGIIRNHLSPHLGRKKTSSLRPLDVESFLQTKSLQALSNRSVIYIHRILSLALEREVKMDQLPRNVASLVSPPPLDTRRVNPWDTSEVRQFISSIVGEEYEDLFITALGTGLRQSELLGLRKMNLSLLSDPPVVSVTETLQRYGQDFRFEEPKSKSSTRTIAIPSSVVTALKRQLSRTFDNQQLIGDEYEDWGLVFANINGTPLRDYVIRKRFYRIQEEAGLRRQRFHDLRHCYASFLLATGVNDQVLQENLGHSTITITKNTYTHLMPSMKADAAEKLEELLFQN